MTNSRMTSSPPQSNPLAWTTPFKSNEIGGIARSIPLEKLTRDLFPDLRNRAPLPSTPIKQKGFEPDNHLEKLTFNIVPDSVLTMPFKSTSWQATARIIEGLCIDLFLPTLSTTKTINDFELLLGGEKGALTLPEAMRKSILKFVRENPDSSTWDCHNFTQAAIGEKTSLCTTTWGKDIIWWKNCIQDIQPGDILKIGEIQPNPTRSGFFGLHTAIYLGRGLYLSKLGKTECLAIQTLEELKKAYPGNTEEIYSPIHIFEVGAPPKTHIFNVLPDKSYQIDGMDSVHSFPITARRIEGAPFSKFLSLLSNSKAINDFELLLGGEKGALTLPEAMRKNILKCIQENPDSSIWDSSSFVHAAYGQKENLYYHYFHNSEWEKKRIEDILPGDVLRIGNPSRPSLNNLKNFKGLRYAIYLGSNLYLLKHHEKPLLLIHILEELRQAFLGEGGVEEAYTFKKGLISLSGPTGNKSQNPQTLKPDPYRTPALYMNGFFDRDDFFYERSPLLELDPQQISNFTVV